jgi:hypothetical protein
LIEKVKNLSPEKLIEVEEFVDFLAQRATQKARQSRHEAIAAYAAQHAGTEADLDEELELAAVEHLLAEERADK